MRNSENTPAGESGPARTVVSERAPAEMHATGWTVAGWTVGLLGVPLVAVLVWKLVRPEVADPRHAAAVVVLLMGAGLVAALLFFTGPSDRHRVLTGMTRPVGAVIGALTGTGAKTVTAVAGGIRIFAGAAGAGFHAFIARMRVGREAPAVEQDAPRDPMEDPA
ncbi:hypothetical protein [Nocardia noduli]|uniref:hypothetical protein n=1 Tax=Nocardia noduli TaxID=2815722 RepID=UPI001C229190|nr:hypothetical protein [Nocardia noduli]